MLKEIRIFPPLGIARLGSSSTPMENYTLTLPDNPTGFRKLTPQPTLVVDGDRVVREKPVDEVDLKLRDGDAVRPVCPFFDVWARFDDADIFVPLTKSHLEDLGLDPEANVKWNVTVGNIKAYRRTGIAADKIIARSGEINDFDSRPLEGRSENFVGGLDGEFIPFGSVQHLRPTSDFGQVRLRFTPAPGKVYGPTGRGQDPNVAKAVYDTGAGRGTWHLHQDGDPGTPPSTSPGGIYAQRRNEDGRLIDENGTVITRDNDLRPVNLGYLDDACDGIIRVELSGLAEPLSAIARVSVGPPDFAPDSLPVRTVNDELEQLVRGALVSGSVTVSEATDILRRAMETVRLMNTVWMNGPGGLAGHLRAFDSARRFFWSRSTTEQTDRGVDQARVISHHANALEDSIEFKEIEFDVDEFIRRSENVGDLSDTTIHKMPGMMRGSDGMPMALTKRQRAKLAAGRNGLDPDPPPSQPGAVDALNLTAQASRLAKSPNPASSYPDTAIANCFPGLEFDFRSIWRRILVGIRLHEASFVVVALDDEATAELSGLEGAILLSVDGRNVFSVVSDSQSPPQNVGFTNLEWANSLAHVAGQPGEQVECRFQVEVGEQTQIRTHSLTVRNLFDRNLVDGELRQSAVISPDVLEEGELTQGLCSPWQADFRECGCYYWAASRPDYVNTESTGGVTTGHNWLLKDRQEDTPRDVPREYEHPYQQMITYDDLYQAWEQHLSFIIAGKDLHFPTTVYC